MKTFGLILNLEKPNALRAVSDIVTYARELGLTLWLEESIPFQQEDVRRCPTSAFAEKGVEAVVVLGGDGTMLSASHALAGQGLPLVGFNIGSLGYLTSVEEASFRDALEQLREDRFQIGRRTLLDVCVERQGFHEERLPEALNDVVISRGISGTAIELDLMLDDQTVSRFLCDGIIVATPTGSTAYSLAAGGPILLPDAEALVISPICPHTLTSRPLVVRDGTRIAIRAVACNEPMLLSVDGAGDASLVPGDNVQIAKSVRTVPVINLPGYNPCDVMRRKLGWGGRSHRK
ncbi:MAG: NAD(+)/NADH kinase [Kiritimatiellae bacterium]|nr:NAD(+)/NADH kinase [Kiritimatiellia bacterium]